MIWKERLRLRMNDNDSKCMNLSIFYKHFPYVKLKKTGRKACKRQKNLLHIRGWACNMFQKGRKNFCVYGRKGRLTCMRQKKYLCFESHEH